MESLFLLAVLACPVGMGLMMWFMFKGMKGGKHGDEPTSLAALKREQARLTEKIEALERERAIEVSPQPPRTASPPPKA